MFKFNHFYACSDKEGPYKRAHIAALLLYCAKGAVDERYIRRGESHSTSTAAPLAQQRRSAEVEEPSLFNFSSTVAAGYTCRGRGAMPLQMPGQSKQCCNLSPLYGPGQGFVTFDVLSCYFVAPFIKKSQFFNFGPCTINVYKVMSFTDRVRKKKL